MKMIRTTLRKNIKHMIFLTILFIMFGLIVMLVYMSVHEQVHASILRSYGISSISKIYIMKAWTYPTNQTEYDLNCNQECMLANNQTDAIGYHTALIIFTLFVIFYVTEIYKLGILEIKKETKEVLNNEK